MSTASGLQIASLCFDSPLGTIRITATPHAIREVHFLDKVEVHKNAANGAHEAEEYYLKDEVEHEVKDEIKNEVQAEHTDAIKVEINRDALVHDKAKQQAFDLIVECRRQLLDYFRGNLQTFDINVDQPGTTFQQKVWQQLSVIHYGNTVSYLTLARELGDQKVIRAAAAANGRNNIAIIVPCHRVIGSSGDLVGYAGGLWRKKWLIAHEQKFAHGVQTLF